VLAAAASLVVIWPISTGTAAAATTLVSGDLEGGASVSPDLEPGMAATYETWNMSPAGHVEIDGGTYVFTSTSQQCNFGGGSSGQETFAEGVGSLSGGCSGVGTYDGAGSSLPKPPNGVATSDTSCDLRYERIDLDMTLSGPCSITVLPYCIAGCSSFTVTFSLTGACQLSPLDMPPTTTYHIQCVLYGR
jgi:hypothetical protein